jgi:hypothetical protein
VRAIGGLGSCGRSAGVGSWGSLGDRL